MMILDRIQMLDAAGTRWCNLASRVGPARLFFGLISRLGDGMFWYALMLAMPFIGGTWTATALMAIVGGVATLTYRRLKEGTRRPRPCEVQATLTISVAPLDRFSFPSGHTLHAAAFTVLACAIVPGLTPMLVPFAVLVALSRLVLGLHYPSDVLVGGGLGAGLAALGLLVAESCGLLV